MSLAEQYPRTRLSPAQLRYITWRFNGLPLQTSRRPSLLLCELACDPATHLDAWLSRDKRCTDAEAFAAHSVITTLSQLKAMLPSAAGTCKHR